MAHEIRSPAGKLLRAGQDEGLDHRRARVARGRGRQLPGRLLRPREGQPAALRRPGRGRRWSPPRSRNSIRAGGCCGAGSRAGTSASTRPGAGGATSSATRSRACGRCPTFDPVHINSIEPRGKDEVVISTRHTDAVYGIQRSSGDDPLEAGRQQDGRLAADRRRPGPRAARRAARRPHRRRRQPQHLRQRQGPAAAAAGRLLPARSRSRQRRLTSASSTTPR